MIGFIVFASSSLAPRVAELPGAFNRDRLEHVMSASDDACLRIPAAEEILSKERETRRKRNHPEWCC